MIVPAKNALARAELYHLLKEVPLLSSGEPDVIVLLGDGATVICHFVGVPHLELLPSVAVLLGGHMHKGETLDEVSPFGQLFDLPFVPLDLIVVYVVERGKEAVRQIHIAVQHHKSGVLFAVGVL